MGDGPWGTKFVGTHLLLTEPGPQDNSWNTVPSYYNNIRFDAIDVLFISPFVINQDKTTYELDTVSDGTLLERFSWVIRAARSQNPNIKIILEQWYFIKDGNNAFQGLIGDNSTEITQYGDAVAKFIESWYDRKLPALNSSGEVSARINGWDVDVESDTKVSHLPKILTSVRNSLDKLSSKLGAPRFSVSITPAWKDYLDNSVASSCDYINTQNYSGGQNVPKTDFTSTVPSFSPSRIIWGLNTEEPWRNTVTDFKEAMNKVSAVERGEAPGIYTWRINSNNYAYENAIQVHIHNIVHHGSLQGAKNDEVLSSNWPFGGRKDGRTGTPLSVQDFN